MCLTGQNVFYKEKIEAVVGQDVRLPCIMEKRTGLHIVSIEWSKNNDENTKLAVYSPKFGVYLFRTNVTMQIVNSSTGSYLNLPGVTEWDSGIYNCDLTTFPLGSIRRETELKIKGKPEGKCMQSLTYTPQPEAAVFTGFNIWIMCGNFLFNCPLHIFHVTPDCIRTQPLCQSQQLFSSEQM